MDIAKVAKEFNELGTDKERWAYMAGKKGILFAMLDNDCTLPQWNENHLPEGGDCDDMPELNGFDNDIGNRDGIFALLEMFGVDAESC